MTISVKQHVDGSLGLEGSQKDSVGQGWMPVTLHYDPGTDVDTVFFVAQRPYRVKGIIGRPEVLNGAAATITIKKAASGTGVAAGTALHSGTYDTNAGADTNQTLTLSTTSSDLDIAAGDAIGMDSSAAITSGEGAITVLLAPK